MNESVCEEVNAVEEYIYIYVQVLQLGIFSSFANESMNERT